MARWIHRCTIAALAGLILTIAAPIHAAPATPEALLAALDAASRAGDRAALDGLITDDFRYALPGSGERLAAHLARRTLPVVPVGTRVEKRRAALTVRLGDEAGVLLARQEADGWRIDGRALTPEGALAFLAGHPMRPPRDARLQLAGGALAGAIDAGDADAARVWMTPAFYGAKRDGGADLIAQCVRKGLGLVPREARSVGAVGAVTMDVVQGGQAVDRIWLLAQRQADGIWRFDGLTEDRQRVQATLAGRIEPRFDPRRLPSEPGAAAVVEALRGALLGRDAPTALALLGPEQSQTPGIGQPRARRWLSEAALRGGVVSPAAVHVDRAQGRGAARFTVRMTRAGDAAGKSSADETVWVYLLRSGGGWSVVDLNFGLTARWFYSGPSPMPRVP